MNLQEIKEAVEAGKTVHWSNQNYIVIKDCIGQWLLMCTINDHCIGLTWADATTLNGKEKDFYVAEDDPCQFHRDKYLKAADVFESKVLEIPPGEHEHKEFFRYKLDKDAAIMQILRELSYTRYYLAKAEKALKTEQKLLARERKRVEELEDEMIGVPE